MPPHPGGKDSPSEPEGITDRLKTGGGGDIAKREGDTPVISFSPDGRSGGSWGRRTEGGTVRRKGGTEGGPGREREKVSH